MGKRVCGIYVLYKDNIPVYVGRSVNVGIRLIKHRTEKDFDRWTCQPCHADDQKRMELETIHLLRPTLNVAPDFNGQYNVKKIVPVYRPNKKLVIKDKRTRGRPPSAIQVTSAERSKARRLLGYKSIQIPPDVVIHLRTIREKYGDATDALAIKRMAYAALGLPMP